LELHLSMLGRRFLALLTYYLTQDEPTQCAALAQRKTLSARGRA
jgi:hypothetical protein